MGKLSTGRQEAYEIFKRDYAQNAAIESNKAELRRRYAEAKALGEQVNAAKSKICEWCCVCVRVCVCVCSCVYTSLRMLKRRYTETKVQILCVCVSVCVSMHDTHTRPLNILICFPLQRN